MNIIHGMSDEQFAECLKLCGEEVVATPHKVSHRAAEFFFNLHMSRAPFSVSPGYRKVTVPKFKRDLETRINKPELWAKRRRLTAFMDNPLPSTPDAAKTDEPCLPF